MGASNGLSKRFKEHWDFQRSMTNLDGAVAIDFSVLLYGWFGFRLENRVLCHQIPLPHSYYAVR
jgi:hypothetical protein